MSRKRYTYQDVEKIVKNANYELISTREEIENKDGYVLTKTKITVWCKNPNHKYSKPELSKFIKGARYKQCLVDSTRLSYEDVKKYIEEIDNCEYKLLSKEYTSVHSNLKLKHTRGFDYVLDQFVGNKIRDTIKTNYCKDNNIKLIRIPYWDFDNIENIIVNELNLK